MKRILSVDIARGFTVLMIAPIHTVMMYSKPTVQHSALGIVLDFIAEGPGAQLFMFIMGMNFTLKPPSGSMMVQRAFYFLIAAYCLNILKFIIPLLLGWMPQNLLSELHLYNEQSAIIFFFLLGDILHFAAIIYPVLFLAHRIKHYQFVSATLAVGIIFLSPYLWDYHSCIGLLNYLLQLIGGHPPNVFFPLFPWLVYPLVGLSVGYYLKKHNNNIVFKVAGYTGAALIFISLFFPYTPLQGDWLPFYRTFPADTIFHLGIVLLWVALINWITQKIKPNYFFQLLIFCSRNITSIYFIQWMLICWLMGFTGYQTIGFSQSVLWMLITTIVTLILARLFVYASKR